MEKKIDPLNDFDGFFEELQNESPRSAAIIAGAFLDALLRELISIFLIDNPDEVEKLLDRHLYSFNSRILMSYCLGLISISVYNDLIAIKNIRNKFAHKMHGFSFDEPGIVNWCESLHFGNTIPIVHYFQDNHRIRFLTGVTQLSMYLKIKILEAEHNKLSSPDDPEISHFIVGDGDKTT